MIVDSDEVKVSDSYDQFPDRVGCAALLDVTETATTRKAKENRYRSRQFSVCSQPDEVSRSRCTYARRSKMISKIELRVH